MAGQDKLRRSELMILQKEEIAIKEMIENYQNTLHRLQVEELTIRSQLGRLQEEEYKSRTTTPLDCLRDASKILDSNQDTLSGLDKVSSRAITMNELQINQSTLNLDAAPLIQRMLHDSQVYEEEDDEEEEED